MAPISDSFLFLKKANFLIYLHFLFLSAVHTCAQTEFSRDSFFLPLRNDLYLSLILHSDSTGIPSFYSSNIFTQVCETGECKPVRILLFWDLLGNYTHYELPEKSILTKLDHVPFSDSDYKKFGTILSDPHSILEDLDISELTNNKEKASIDEIDGITGATPKSISDAIVDGAVYTCYTIWHLANSSLRVQIQKLTDSLCTSETVLNKLISADKPDLRRWVISKTFTKEKAYPTLTRKIISTIDPSNIFESKFILTEIPPTLLSLTWVQQILWGNYPDFKYSQQIIILERYQGIPIDSQLQAHVQKIAMNGNEKQKNLAQQLEFEDRR